jgi:flagellar protein FlgJ
VREIDLLNTQQRNFLSAIAVPALESARRTGIPAAVIIAQAALESGWGNSQLFEIANNPFGIKLPERKGAAVSYAWIEMPTTEVVNGVAQQTRARFRSFKTLDEAFAAHGALLSQARYAPVRAAADAASAAQALQDCGYSTDPDYASKLERIIIANGLEDSAPIGPKDSANYSDDVPLVRPAAREVTT